MTVHDFKKSLALSESYANAPWWEAIYKKAFPGFCGMSYVNQDGWAQRGGIDRIVILNGGSTFFVDEKVRFREYGDFALERWSDQERRVPGWIQKPLACNYIAYAFSESQRCYMLPFQQLRCAWRDHGREWIEKFQKIEAKNRGYVTECIAVPIPVVLDAILGTMKITW